MCLKKLCAVYIKKRTALINTCKQAKCITETTDSVLAAETFCFTCGRKQGFSLYILLA